MKLHISCKDITDILKHYNNIDNIDIPEFIQGMISLFFPNVNEKTLNIINNISEEYKDNIRDFLRTITTIYSKCDDKDLMSIKLDCHILRPFVNILIALADITSSIPNYAMNRNVCKYTPYINPNKLINKLKKDYPALAPLIEKNRKGLIDGIKCVCPDIGKMVWLINLIII